MPMHPRRVDIGDTANTNVSGREPSCESTPPSDDAASVLSSASDDGEPLSDDSASPSDDD